MSPGTVTGRVCEKPSTTTLLLPSSLALHWLLTRPAVAAVIVGSEIPEELRRNLEAFELGLDSAHEAALTQIGESPAAPGG